MEAKELSFAPLKLVVSKFQDALSMIKLISSGFSDAVLDVVLSCEAFLALLITIRMLLHILTHFFIRKLFLLIIRFMAMVIVFSLRD